MGVKRLSLRGRYPGHGKCPIYIHIMHVSIAASLQHHCACRADYNGRASSTATTLTTTAAQFLVDKLRRFCQTTKEDYSLRRLKRCYVVAYTDFSTIYETIRLHFPTQVSAFRTACTLLSFIGTAAANARHPIPWFVAWIIQFVSLRDYARHSVNTERLHTRNSF